MIKTHSLILSAVIAALFSMPPAWAVGTDSRNPSVPSPGSGTLNPNRSMETAPIVKRLEIVQAKFERGFGVPGSHVALRVSVRNQGVSSTEVTALRARVKRSGAQGDTVHRIPMPSIGTVATESIDTRLPKCSVPMLGSTCFKPAEGRYCYTIRLETSRPSNNPKIEIGPSKQACILVGASPPLQQ